MKLKNLDRFQCPHCGVLHSANDPVIDWTLGFNDNGEDSLSHDQCEGCYKTVWFYRCDNDHVEVKKAKPIFKTLD